MGKSCDVVMSQVTIMTMAIHVVMHNINSGLKVFFNHSQTHYFHCYGFGDEVWSLGLCIMVAGEVISLVSVSVSHGSDTVT